MKDFQVMPTTAVYGIHKAIEFMSTEQRWLNGHPWSRSSASDEEHRLWLERCEQLQEALSALRGTLRYEDA
jgi:hypothetical protein